MGSLPDWAVRPGGEDAEETAHPLKITAFQPPPSGGTWLYILGLGGWESFPPSLHSEIISWEITGYDGAGGFASLTGYSSKEEFCSLDSLLYTFVRLGHAFFFAQHLVASFKNALLGVGKVLSIFSPKLVSLGFVFFFFFFTA